MKKNLVCLSSALAIFTVAVGSASAHSFDATPSVATVQNHATSINAKAPVSVNKGSIPSRVEEEYKAPNGEWGILVKYEGGGYTRADRATLAVIAAGLSAVTKAPINWLTAMLSAAIGMADYADLYYEMQHYVIPDGTSRKFVVTKFYKDSNMTQFVDKTVNWEF